MTENTLDASELGWKKGCWPIFVMFRDVLYIRGDVMPEIDAEDKDTYSYDTLDQQSRLWVRGDHLTPRVMGWRPRQWPKSFVDEETHAEYFRIARIEHDDGPNRVPIVLAGYEYITEHGDLMKVYNA